MMNSVCLLLVLVSTVFSAPQLKMSNLEYQTMKSLLKGKNPTSFVSVSPVVKVKNAPQESFVLLNIGEKKPGLPNLRNNFHPGSQRFQRTPISTLYRDELNDIEPINKRDGFPDKATQELSRFKRDDDYDYEEEPVRYADELQFGLSTGGGLFGSSVGSYFDTTGQATVKLIRNLETLGSLVLGQLDDFLDRQDEKRENGER